MLKAWISRRAGERAQERGSALILAVIALGALSALGITLVLMSTSDRRSARYERDHSDALNAAETGVALAKRRIQDQDLTFIDEDSDGYPDFRLVDTLDNGGAYDVFGESSEDVSAGSLSPFSGDFFTLSAEGDVRGAVRRVQSVIQHDSFLKYARLVSIQGTSYACGAVLTGEVYVGTDLGVPTGCTTAKKAMFLEFVAAHGKVQNPNEGIFYKGYSDSAAAIDLQASVDFNKMREKSKGTAAYCDCEGDGRVGIYMSYDPLQIGANGTIDFSKFDFRYFDSAVSPDTIIRYDGQVLRDTTTSAPMLIDDFNGLIFYEGDAYVKGRLQGISARSVTIYATDDVIIEGDIVTGTEGFDPITRLPTGAGNPVNLGLIGNNYVYIGNTPRVLNIDAALMAVNHNWRCVNSAQSAHPVAPTGNYDLDRDGIVGESPVNNDPDAGTGWNEVITAANQSTTWVLNINGPIITYDGGSASPWSDASVIGTAPGPTRRYNYDLDITDFPPPCFPVPLNLWKDLSWTEVYE